MHLHISVQVRWFFLHLHLLVFQFDLQPQTLSSINAMGVGKQSVITGTNSPSIFSQPKSSGGGKFCKDKCDRFNTSAT